MYKIMIFKVNGRKIVMNTFLYIFIFLFFLYSGKVLWSNPPGKISPKNIKLKRTRTKAAKKNKYQHPATKEMSHNLLIEKSFDEKRIDPFFSGVLSWYTPGLGQLYSKKPVKGAVYFLIETSLFLSAVFSIANINFGTDSGTGIGFGFQLKRNEVGEIPEANKNMAIALFSLGVIFHIWNVVDAVNTAKNYNRELYKKLELQYKSESYYRGEHRKEDTLHYVSVLTHF